MISKDDCALIIVLRQEKDWSLGLCFMFT